MPNTKSAERRMRNSARRHLHNQSNKSRLKTLEKEYLALVAAGQKNEASAALRAVTAAFDKAAKNRGTFVRYENALIALSRRRPRRAAAIARR